VELDGQINRQNLTLSGRARRDAALLRWGFTAKPF
jgi:hypothetical protein